MELALKFVNRGRQRDAAEGRALCLLPGWSVHNLRFLSVCVCGGGPLVQGSQHLPHAAPTLHSGQDHPTADVARTPCWVPPHLVLLQQSSCSLLRRAPFLHTPEGRFPPNDHQVAPLMCGESGSQSVMGVGAPPRELSLGQMG